ncbi:hypothetical protein [Streptomyces sp. NBC_01446]|nr:hypothetical protein [Streptomyces sp. NBC_01446]
MMLPLSWLYGLPSRRAHLLLVTAFATLIGVSLLLCPTLGHPLLRRTRRVPEPFKESVLAQFSR